MHCSVLTPRWIPNHIQELQGNSERERVGLNGMKALKNFMKDMIVTDGRWCCSAAPCCHSAQHGTTCRQFFRMLALPVT